MFVPSAVLLVFAALLAPPSSAPDEVKMKDGKEYKNLKLLKETPTQYTFEDLDGKKITLAKDSIEKYEKKPTIRDEVKERVKKAGSDAKALMEIAGWAKAQGLPKDAKEVLELVIKAEPENAEARAALDYVKQGNEWVLKKDIAAKAEKERGERLKPLGYKEVQGKWISPAEASRKAAGLVQAGKYWVTPDQKKAIEAKELEYREGDWLSKDELVKFDKEQQRKVKGAWKPILDADEVHRDAKDPWVLKGAYVQVVSVLKYSKVLPGFKAADDAVNAAVALSGVEPDVFGKAGPLVVIIEKDPEGYGARGHMAKDNWPATRSSSDGVFYAPEFGKGGGAAVTYYVDDGYVRWWAGRGAFEAYVGRITDITKLDPILLDTFAAYFANFVGDKYHPACSAGFMFDKTKPMPPASKIFEGFKRDKANEVQFRQLSFLVHYLVKKNPESAQLAFQRFLAGGITHRELIEAVLGKVTPAELDADYAAAWSKYAANFVP
jgi:hypothetical protein